MSQRIIWVVCPHCGLENRTVTDSLYGEIKMMVCEVEEGGCDQRFVVEIKCSVESRTAKLDWSHK